MEEHVVLSDIAIMPASKANINYGAFKIINVLTLRMYSWWYFPCSFSPTFLQALPVICSNWLASLLYPHWSSKSVEIVMAEQASRILFLVSKDKGLSTNTMRLHTATLNDPKK